MGFFSHEAVDIDPRTGIAYLTEDDFRGAIVDPSAEVVADYSTSEIDPATGLLGTGSRVSFLFRYIPINKSQEPGALQEGGTLQVLTIDQRPNYNMDLAFPGNRFQVVWRDVDPAEPHESAEDLQAARFGRLEGAYFAGGAFWFDDTIGGEARLGKGDAHVARESRRHSCCRPRSRSAADRGRGQRSRRADKERGRRSHQRKSDEGPGAL